MALPPSFIHSFGQKLCTEMIASFNYAFHSGTLSISQKRGIISLIPKKDKDTSLLENLRPISLLNFDYKILKVIAKRLEKLFFEYYKPRSNRISERLLNW